MLNQVPLLLSLSYVFKKNSASYCDGGVIYSIGKCDIVENCLFEDWNTSNEIGAIDLVFLQDCNTG
jgi:predicted outer membrane repeat protein